VVGNHGKAIREMSLKAAEEVAVAAAAGTGISILTLEVATTLWSE